MASIEDRVDTKKIAFVAFSLVLVIVILIIGVAALYRSAVNNAFQTKVVDQPAREFTSLQSKQLAQLNAYAWMDRKAGVVAVPIDRAMDLVIRDAHENQDTTEQPSAGEQATSEAATPTVPMKTAAPAAPGQGGTQ